MGHAIVVEKDRESTLFNRTPPWLIQKRIIPSIGMKNIGQGRGAKDKSHLIAGHAGVQLCGHLAGDDDTLLDVNLVHQAGVRPDARYPGTAR
jgi:hypothetical protein